MVNSESLYPGTKEQININLDALSKHGLGKGAGTKGDKAKPPRKCAKQDNGITVQQVDGLKGMMSNPTNLYSSASEPSPSNVLTLSACGSLFTYHLAHVNEPVPSHLFPLSGCASPFTHPSMYSLDGEPGPCSCVCCLHVTLPISCSSTEYLHEPYYSQFVPGNTPIPSYAPVYSLVKCFTLKLLNGHIKVCAGFHNPDGSLPHMIFVFAMKNPER